MNATETKQVCIVQENVVIEEQEGKEACESSL